MVRTSRSETQRRTRGAVLAAARAEFAERGFRAAKIDAIAGRAGLTRGAVYSNFPGKRALYLTVLADLAEDAAPAGNRPAAPAGRSAAEAMGALAQAWVARLPAGGEGGDEGGGEGGDEAGGEGGGPPARLDRDLMPELLADEGLRLAFAQLMKLNALLVALALENLDPPAVVPGAPPARLVRLAGTLLTTLHGASQLALAAPGFAEPFDLVGLGEKLAGLRLNDWWAPPQAVPPAVPDDAPWSPPARTDAVRLRPAPLGDDGVVAFLGPHRPAAAEEAVRAAPPGSTVTLVLAGGDPRETGPLARLILADLCGCLRVAFPPAAWPRLAVVHDESGAVAAAAGITVSGDTTETAIRVMGGRIVARADGRGACHAVASVDTGVSRGARR
ncbi:TetR/AcrR family transcriptional regulator [Streptomyces sp. NBC_01476]|uniref:TetR/AcrR family transcriptional regulator n=1 Tax=Streptomyces sp. NBC_01476 TaxID=2903881 RepID=UPI002E358200|nr:TetR/AcrR family transcriptional regulator [Streptomyces sp. NBC_01476]